MVAEEEDFTDGGEDLIPEEAASASERFREAAEDLAESIEASAGHSWDSPRHRDFPWREIEEIARMTIRIPDSVPGIWRSAAASASVLSDARGLFGVASAIVAAASQVAAMLPEAEFAEQEWLAEAVAACGKKAWAAAVSGKLAGGTDLAYVTAKASPRMARLLVPGACAPIAGAVLAAMRAEAGFP
jgi:hypothetical protein